MIVVDASVLANALADDQDAGASARRQLRAAREFTAPDLVDVDTVSVLRERWLRRTLTEERFSTAIGHLQQLDFERVPTLRLMPARTSCAPTSAPMTPATSRSLSTSGANCSPRTGGLPLQPDHGALYTS